MELSKIIQHLHITNRIHDKIHNKISKLIASCRMQLMVAFTI